MSWEGGEKCGDTDGEDTGAPTPSASAWSPHLRMSTTSMLSLLLKETGTSSTSLRTSSWPWWEKWGSSFSGSPMRSLAPRPGPPRNGQLSDILIYLAASAARCHVDLPQVLLSKMDTNQPCYPAYLSCGSACKYTDLPPGATSKDHAMGTAVHRPGLNLETGPTTQHGITGQQAGGHVF